MRNRFLCAALAALPLLTGCSPPVMSIGDEKRGASDITKYGCGACHTIPGISGAHGKVGPSLQGIASRLYVAGDLPNQAGNLMRWIENPHGVNPKTAMPNVGVTPRDAADISAYLYTLK